MFDLTFSIFQSASIKRIKTKVYFDGFCISLNSFRSIEVKKNGEKNKMGESAEDPAPKPNESCAMEKASHFRRFLAQVWPIQLVISTFKQKPIDFKIEFTVCGNNSGKFAAIRYGTCECLSIYYHTGYDGHFQSVQPQWNTQNDTGWSIVAW